MRNLICGSTLRASLMASSLLALSACGAGGTGGSVQAIPTPIPTPVPTPVPVPVPAPIPTVATSAEYKVNAWAFQPIDLAYAIDNGFTGKGITIGVMDDGFQSIPDLAGSLSPLSKDFGEFVSGTVTATGLYTDGPFIKARNELFTTDPKQTHGTFVSLNIFAPQNGAASVGVASEAKMALLRLDDDVTLNRPGGVIDRSSFITDPNIRDALIYAGTAGIKVVNKSLGLSVDQVRNTDGSLKSDLNLTSFRAGVDSYVATGGVIVESAGNSGADVPAEWLIATDAQRRGFIFVGAVVLTSLSFEADGLTLRPGPLVIGDFSNRAGAAKDRYVVAPAGALHRLADTPANQVTGPGGTSTAAPIVAGLIGTILQKWPFLSGQQAADVVLATATPMGDPNVYGRGLVNFKAALSPVDPKLASITGSAVAITGSSIALSSAFDAAKLGTALDKIVVLDAFGRDFTLDLGSSVGQFETRSAIRALVSSLHNGQAASFETNGTSITTAFRTSLGPVRPGYRSHKFGSVMVGRKVNGGLLLLGMGRTPWGGGSDTLLSPPSNALVAYAPSLDRGVRYGQSSLTFDFGSSRDGKANAASMTWHRKGLTAALGVLQERGTVLGAYSSGAFKLGDRASTGWSELRITGKFGDWSLAAYGSVGATSVTPAPASILRLGTLVSTRAGLEASRHAGPGTFTLGLARPLTVDLGDVVVHAGESFAPGTNSLAYGDRQSSLSRSRLPVVSGGYELASGRVSFTVGVAHDMTDAATSGVVSYRIAFR